MPLHPDARRWLDQLPAAPDTELDPVRMRADAAKQWVRIAPAEPVSVVENRTIPGPHGEIPVRVFVPQGAGPFPLLVWLHGGGWVIGSLDENEAACRAICNRSGAVVMSVEYRLAPEHRFPAAAQDAFAAVCWAAENGAEIAADQRRIAVAGESAGGNLAAVCALMARDNDGPALALQVLISPVLGTPSDGRKSYVDFATGYFLTRAEMEFFFRQYLNTGADLGAPYLSPLRAADLSGLAPALMLTAEYDVLRDEGEEYARRLTGAGVRCELIRYDGQIHGFFGLLDEHMSVAAGAHARVAAALRTAFHHQS